MDPDDNDDDNDGADGDCDASAHMTQEQEEREGHQRFAKMFEEIDNSSDDEGVTEGVEVAAWGREVEGEVVRWPGGV